MKRIIQFVCLTLLMTSCSVKTYYQVVDVKSSNLEKESNNYVYNDGVCKIVYNFWSEGGNAGFQVENLSDEVVYMDLGNTFYIKNGVAYDYYKARNYGFGKSSQVTKGSSVSATAYGIWRPWPLAGYLGSITAQSQEFASSGSNSNLSYAEKPIVAIPPHASKSFSEYIIMGDVFQDCSVNLMVQKNNPEGMTLTEADSPIRFSNYITYKKGESGQAKVVTNDFYIGGYTNYFSKDIIKIQKVGCKKTVFKPLFDKYAPDRFYVKYTQKHSNDYSADAIPTSSNGSYNVAKGEDSDMYLSVRSKKNR